MISDQELFDLAEKLAAIEHDRWAHWQSYVHRNCIKNSDGSLTIPTEFVQKWERQINTDYSQLTHEEKESDRDQVRKYLPLINAVIATLRP